MDKPKVLVVIGSDSDFEIIKGCLQTLKRFSISFDCVVCSAHRTPETAASISKNAINDGYECIIAAAGKAAHLPGVLAAFTILPVIGIPIKSDSLDGMDALLSIVQMPSGIPVATVAINGATNAGILAAQILSTKYNYLKEALNEYKSELKVQVENKNLMLKEKIANL